MTAAADPWLSDDQQRVWRRWLLMNRRLTSELNRSLQRNDQISLQDFQVLVALSETEGHRLRIAALAEILDWERSRLSHHLRRMAARGLVERTECPDDKRGAFTVLTETGMETITRAARQHADAVRRWAFDDVPESELAAVESFAGRVLGRLPG